MTASESWQEGWEAAICRCPDGYCVCVSRETALEKAREAAKYAVIKTIANEMQDEVRYWLGYAESLAARPNALDALERARSAWERTQPQLFLDLWPDGLEEAPSVGTASPRARPTANPPP